MSLLSTLLGVVSGRRANPGRVRFSLAQWKKLLRGRFDIAQTTPDNRNHWQWADSFSADAALSSGIRKTIRERARYEVANNSYAKGIVSTLANDLVGTGPRLQLVGLPVREDNQQVERLWSDWARAVQLAQRLRTGRAAKVTDGEVFILKASNPMLRTPVKLNPVLVECDQIADVVQSITIGNEVDGIRYDADGNPVSYTMLDAHPGSAFPVLGARQIPAANMLHYFRADRPGQHRGLSEIMPALPLFAILRRFTLATTSAAETAAKFAAVMETDAPAEEIDDGPLPEIEIERNIFIPLPAGRKLSQLKAEHPATTYPEFVRAILNEVARCMNMPVNIAMGDSSDHSYASGRMDHQTYFLDILVERSVIEAQVLDDLFASWLAEASLIEGYLPQSARMTTADFSHKWHWDGREHVDPQKEANADDVALRNHSKTYAAIYGRRGLDWQVELKQAAEEQAFMRSVGLTTQPKTQPTEQANANQEEETAAAD